MWAFLPFVCASLICAYFRRFWKEASPLFESGWPQPERGFSDVRCVRVGRESRVFLGWSLSVVSCHRQSSTGGVVVSATCATTPLSSSVIKTKRSSIPLVNIVKKEESVEGH